MTSEQPTPYVVSPELGSAKASRRATFFGTAFHKVSDRNQVAIPRHLMKAVQEAQEGQLLLIRVSQEGFLRLYTQNELDAKVQEIRVRQGLSAGQKTELIRNLAGNAVPVEPDTQGRFVLPARWVEELGLREEVSFCGAFSWIEIWPAAARRDLERNEQQRSADSAALISEILNA